MALSPSEEDVLADLEMQFRPEGEGGWEDLPPGLRLAPAVACVLAGIALLVGARLGWFMDQISFVSGFSATSIAFAATAIGCLLVLAAPLVLRGLASLTSGAGGAGGSSSHAPSSGRQMRQRTIR